MNSPLPQGWKEVNLHDYIVEHQIPAPEVDPESLAKAYANMIKVDNIQEAVRVITELDDLDGPRFPLI